MPNNWKTYKLGEICSVKGRIGWKGYTVDDLVPEGPLVIGATEVTKNGLDVSKCQSLTLAKYEESPDIMVSKGDIILVKTGNGIGQVGIVNNEIGDATINPNVALLKEFKNCSSSFLYYKILSPQIQHLLKNSSSSSAQPAINQATIKSFDITLPPLPEQRAIASILSALDDKIELNLQMNKTLEEMAMTLYKHWFVDDTNNIVKTLPLEKILDFVVDNRGKTAPTSNEGIPLIATNCVKNQTIYPTYEKVRYIDQETYKNWFRSHPVPGDILFVNKGAPGSVNLIPDPIDFCIAQDMIALRVNQKFVSNFYLFAYFRSSSVQNEIMNMSVGTTIPHLKKTDLLKFQIPIPNFDYLNRYTNKVAPIFDNLNSNRIEIQILTTLRDTLLPKLISGEVRVKDIEQTISQAL